MAKVVAEETRMVVHPEWQVWIKILGYGAAIGLLYWLLAYLMGRYVIEPLLCREIVDGASCMEASELAGKISTVLIAVASILVLVRFSAARPLIVAVGAAIVLWDFSLWTAGLFWLESVVWAIILYAVTYCLLSWIARHNNAVVAIVTALVVTVAIRIALSLV